MSLLIVGATGTLGRQVTRRALDEGYEVRCLVRSARKAGFLKEWGAELVPGDLTLPDMLPAAFEGVTAVVDASTTRATDSVPMHQVDWDGKVALIQAAKAANVERFVFFSILDAEQYPNVPLMNMKHCTELFLAESGIPYTVLRPCGFFQGLIGQYAIPILEKQAVWVMGNTSPIAYMDTQDVAKFAVKALQVPKAVNCTLPVVGSRAWSAYEIIRVCERMSGQDAKITRMPIELLRVIRRVVLFFEWGWNVADRLSFAEVIGSGQPMNASMDETYTILGMDASEVGTLEDYLKEYFSRIMKKLKELEYEREKRLRKKKKRSPFKTPKS